MSTTATHSEPGQMQQKQRLSFRQDLAETGKEFGNFRLFELVMGFLLIFESTFDVLPLPLNQVVMIGLIVIAAFLRPKHQIKQLHWIVAILSVLLVYVGFVSALADPTEYAADWTRRLLRMVLTVLFIISLASGRLDYRALVSGFGLGLIANAILFYAGVAPDTYGGVLMGYQEDKNVAGLSYSIVGILLVAFAGRVRRVLVVLLFALLVYLTGSRTSMYAYAAGVAWVYFSPYLGMIGRWLGAIAVYWVGAVLSRDYAQAGEFADREGSDALRERIDEAAEIKVSHASSFGDGLGEAYVLLDDSTWYFHNSYQTALVEGGWFWLIGLLVASAIALHPLAQGKTHFTVAIAQAAGIATLVSATRLGEVLFTLQWALVIAAGLLAFVWASQSDPADSQTSEPSRGGEDPPQALR